MSEWTIGLITRSRVCVSGYRFAGSPASVASPFYAAAIAVTQTHHRPGVHAPGALAAALPQTWGAGTRRDPFPDEESRGDPTSGGKCICRSKLTNTGAAATRVLRRSKSADCPAPLRLGMPRTLRRC